MLSHTIEAVAAVGCCETQRMAMLKDIRRHERS
jgi:hypothetical protein